MDASLRRGTSSARTDDRSTLAFAEAVAIMARLRGQDGCPWDREQSFDSIRKHTIEEAYEVLDAIERRDWPNLTEELGDLLLQVLFYAQMAGDEGLFTIADVLETLNRKLIRRHPHVFGEAASAAAGNLASVDAAVDGSATRVLANWEAIKRAEKSAPEPQGQASLLNQVLRAQPALLEAQKLGSKASKVGFDWPEWRDLLAKVEEETAELVAAVETRNAFEARDAFVARDAYEKQIPSANDNSKSQDDGKAGATQHEVESELGDLLFTVVNLGRHLGVDAEMALRGTNARFRQRFRKMEMAASDTLGSKGLSNHSPAELEELWIQAKASLMSAPEVQANS